MFSLLFSSSSSRHAQKLFVRHVLARLLIIAAPRRALSTCLRQRLRGESFRHRNFDCCIPRQFSNEVSALRLGASHDARLGRFHEGERVIAFFLFSGQQRKFSTQFQSINVSYVQAVIFVLVLRTVLFIQLCVCVYKAIASSVFFVRAWTEQLIATWTDFLKLHFSRFKYFLPPDDLSPDMNCLLDLNAPLSEKFLFLLNYVIWTLFDTSFGGDTDDFIPGKAISSMCMLIGTAYNIYILIHILNIMSLVHAPRIKYYQIMNQLDAYMQMKQFPSRLQHRLRFFYRKKFRGFHYREDEILAILSGESTAMLDLNFQMWKPRLRRLAEPLEREILINTDQLFVERTQLFKNIPKMIVSKIAGSCKKEQFLPNDLVTRAQFIALICFLLTKKKWTTQRETNFQIAKAGSIDCMFFIASGTVCVTTTNGRELCHLVDGDHFGEVALILKNNKVGSWEGKTFEKKNFFYELLLHRLKRSTFTLLPSASRLSRPSNFAKFISSITRASRNTCKLMRQLCKSWPRRPTSGWEWRWRLRRSNGSACTRESPATRLSIKSLIANSFLFLDSRIDAGSRKNLNSSNTFRGADEKEMKNDDDFNYFSRSPLFSAFRSS